ncbi:exodeoxyribonuclease V subunit alpha [Actinobacillus genomosp. 2]|uniref:exodeoxyribonuclease V subunit alpha n=1 Tax=Actinobacillus genomosp. 2 TaxID=230709 RepID=UPI0024425267|nr:exodeoxyribonuclease V subunit alpha [Actinobacillus genomosp. 2]WGE32794.1 exodeoxyribonuclease V subunit alpha [Actinobacillus genomosp. 2]
MLTLLYDLKQENIISELDYQFAKMIDRKQQGYSYTEQQKNLAVLLAALLSFHVMQGHSAIHLDNQSVWHFFNSPSHHDKILQKIDHIQPLEWQNLLQNHIAFSSDPLNVAPMLFQQGLLYFYRYWQAEHNIANYLVKAVEFPEEIANAALDKQIIAKFFEESDEINWQKVAVATAIKKKFTVISGGPGTGKTTTVAKLLAALQEKQLRSSKEMLNIALVAPTGKAAARLKESISSSLNGLNLTFDIPTTASTIHRLLGIRPQSDEPRFHKKNPLHIDLLVVDEASMIDLFLMEKLMAALKPSTRLILLGDKDQLASVEAGAIMGELGEFLQQGYSQTHCDYLNQVANYQLASQGKALAICDSLCHLKKSYRFNDHSGIGQLAKLVNEKQAVKSWQILTKGSSDLTLIEYDNVSAFPDKQQWVQNCVKAIVDKAVELYREYLTLVKQRFTNPRNVSVNEIFEAFQKVRFLSALRISEFGVEQLNKKIEAALASAKLISLEQSKNYYMGKPLLITQNSPQHHIYSGDIGIILPDEHKHPRVYFDTKINEEYLNLSLNRIPEFETAYVMTVHKSQGSEFEHTLLVTPLHFAPVMSKELIYTAITRAKKHFTLFGSKQIWLQAVNNNIQRQSGLKVQLMDLIS